MVLYTGTDALAFVVSLNLRRRHLTDSQRATLASQIDCKVVAGLSVVLAVARIGRRKLCADAAPRLSSSVVKTVVNLAAFKFYHSNYNELHEIIGGGRGAGIENSLRSGARVCADGILTLASESFRRSHGLLCWAFMMRFSAIRYWCCASSSNIGTLRWEGYVFIERIASQSAKVSALPGSRGSVLTAVFTMTR